MTTGLLISIFELIKKDNDQWLFKQLCR